MKLSVIIFTLVIVGCWSAPRPQVIPEEDAEFKVISVVPKRVPTFGNEFGSVAGEILVDSGVIGIVSMAKKEKKEGPSFSPFISHPGVSLSVGTGEVGQDVEKKPPKHLPGATLVFNNEAAIAEIS